MTTTICGFHVGRLPKTFQFAIYTCGIFSCYLLNGLVSEAIFRVPGFQSYGWFLTLFQYFFYVVCSYSEFQREDKSTRITVPVRSYAVLALLTVLTMGMSNASVGYMNYPTQLVFKSCKIPFVMLGAILLQGKRHDLYDFSSAFTMTTGLICFTLIDSTVSPQFELKVQYIAFWKKLTFLNQDFSCLFLGVIMVCCALVADAFVGNLQEKLMKSHSLSQASLIYHTYTFGFFVILFLTLATGEFTSALQFSQQNFSDVMPLLVLFSATGYLGINFVLALIVTFGAVWAVTMTTLRKAMTICISFIIFEKSFSFHYVWSGFLVIAGIYMNSHKKQCLVFCNSFGRLCNLLTLLRRRQKITNVNAQMMQVEHLV